MGKTVTCGKGHRDLSIKVFQSGHKFEPLGRRDPCHYYRMERSLPVPPHRGQRPVPKHISQSSAIIFPSNLRLCSPRPAHSLHLKDVKMRACPRYFASNAVQARYLYYFCTVNEIFMFSDRGAGFNLTQWQSLPRS